MKRLILALAFGLISLPIVAQHGGGHASSGGHGSAAHGSFAGHSGGTGFSGTHAGGQASHSFSRGASSDHSLQSSARNFNHFRRAPYRSYGFRNDCYGYRCRGIYGYGYGYPGCGYGYPWSYGACDPNWWWDSGSSYDYNEDREREIGAANEMSAQSLDEQRMRQQSDQDIYAPAAPARPRSQLGSSDRTSDVVPPTILVFHDQHKKEVDNYAIVGQTLWIFSAQRTEKIPLSDLDLPATNKANDERGVDFRIPAAREGQ